MHIELEILYNFGIALLIAVSVVAVIYSLLMLLTARVRVESTRQAVVSQIAAIVHQHIPLSTGLALAAQSESYRAQRRLNGISRLLTQGLSLSESMQGAFPECPGMVVSLVRAGEQVGQLPASVEQADGYLRDRSRMTRFDTASMLPYALIILMITTFVALMFLYVVVPKFEEIMADFSVEGSQWILNDPLSPALFANALITMSILLFAAAILAASVGMRSRSTPHPDLLSRAADWLRWHTPGLHRLEVGQGMTVACNAMNFCIVSGMNLHEAAATAADLDINWRLRQQLSMLAADLARGVDARQAARSAGVGEIAGVALAAGRRHGDVSAALRFAADYYAGIVSRWWILISNLAWPLCTLVLASIVGILIYAMFQPLLLLIDSVMISTGL